MTETAGISSSVAIGDHATNLLDQLAEHNDLSQHVRVSMLSAETLNMMAGVMMANPTAPSEALELSPGLLISPVSDNSLQHLIGFIVWNDADDPLFVVRMSHHVDDVESVRDLLDEVALETDRLPLSDDHS